MASSVDTTWNPDFTCLGVTGTTLSLEEKRSLDERGYLLLPRVLGPALLEQLRAAFEAAFADEHGTGAHAGGTRHARGERLHSELCSALYTHPKLIAAAVHVLGRPFRLVGMTGRDPLPGHGAQGLHADWGPREAGDPYYHLNSLWLLDDFTRENGGTRLVPGSHLRTGKVPRAVADPASHHPEEIGIVAPAGSALIFNAHLLHSGVSNRSQSSRRVLSCSFVAGDAPYYGGVEGTEHPLASAAWLAPEVRRLLGVVAD
jgi:hypothetical protein